MSVGYVGVQWSRHKRIYDLLVVAAVASYIAIFIIVSTLTRTGPDAVGDEVLLIRATGSCAIVLLHVILCIGPLARLSPRFLPLLYNRRHLGVMTFLVALAHGVVVTGYYHGFGVLNPLHSLLTINTSYLSLQGFPFQSLGVLALVILFLLAATSHDFWLKNLSAAAWKRLHMSVYLAYALLIGHVGLGSMVDSRSDLAPVLLALGAVVVCSLHLLTGLRERRRDTRGVDAATTPDVGATNGATHSAAIGAKTDETSTWIDVGAPDDIPMDRARTVCTAHGERIAVFRHKDGVSAVTNVCAHQGGPLGEGKVIDGCITCPWHGWQYRPADGCSPPPFVEKIHTYQVRIRAGRVEVRSAAEAPGTPIAPARSEAVR